MGIELEDAQPTAGELLRAIDLVDSKYKTDDWVYQRSLSTDSMGTSTIRTPDGLVRAYIALSGNTIKSALFTGDFNQLPEPLADFESTLKWSRLDEHDLTLLGSKTMRQGTGLGIPKEDLIDLVLDAGRRAQAMEVAAPSRTGSCYFPERRSGD